MVAFSWKEGVCLCDTMQYHEGINEFAINELVWLPKSVQSLMETSAQADQLYLICVSIQSMPIGEFKKNSVLQCKIALPRD